jgi:hypothetical protein
VLGEPGGNLAERGTAGAEPTHLAHNGQFLRDRPRDVTIASDTTETLWTRARGRAVLRAVSVQCGRI